MPPWSARSVGFLSHHPSFTVHNTPSKSEPTSAEKPPELPRSASKFVRAENLDLPYPAIRRHYHRFHRSSHGLKFFNWTMTADLIGRLSTMSWVSERLRSLSSSNTFLSNRSMAALNVLFSSAVSESLGCVVSKVKAESAVHFVRLRTALVSKMKIWTLKKFSRNCVGYTHFSYNIQNIPSIRGWNVRSDPIRSDPNCSKKLKFRSDGLLM